MSNQLQYIGDFQINECVKYLLDKHDKTGSVLEIGTKRWGTNPTHHKQLFPLASRYVMTDFEPGIDVDVVADAHKLSETFGENTFDVIWSSSTWEHLHSPWIASSEVMKVLKPGGLVCIQTHFCFPWHNYPGDYFRFTREALEHLFCDLSEKISCYQYPCAIVPNSKIDVWNDVALAFLNVCIAGMK
jgi:SAM-dependent methyltransferase